MTNLDETFWLKSVSIKITFNSKASVNVISDAYMGGMLVQLKDSFRDCFSKSKKDKFAKKKKIQLVFLCKNSTKKRQSFRKLNDA